LKVSNFSEQVRRLFGRSYHYHLTFKLRATLTS